MELHLDCYEVSGGSQGERSCRIAHILEVLLLLLLLLFDYVIESQNHRLEKTSKIIKSNHPPNATMSTHVLEVS